MVEQKYGSMILTKMIEFGHINSLIIHNDGGKSVKLRLILQKLQYLKVISHACTKNKESSNI